MKVAGTVCVKSIDSVPDTFAARAFLDRRAIAPVDFEQAKAQQPGLSPIGSVDFANDRAVEAVIFWDDIFKFSQSR